MPPNDPRVPARRCAIQAAIVALVALAATGCSTLGGTYDHSRSLARASALDGRAGLVVLAPRPNAQLPSLDLQLERAVTEALRMTPHRALVSSDSFRSALAKQPGQAEAFAGWLAQYRDSGFLEPKRLRAFSAVTRTRYALILREAEVRREPMDVRTAIAETGCSPCTIPDAKNIWGVHLIVLADLVDLAGGRVVWQGVGEATAVTSNVSRLDFGLVQYNLRQPSVGSQADQLVAYVANGIAREVAGGNASGVTARQTP